MMSLKNHFFKEMFKNVLTASQHECPVAQAQLPDPTQTNPPKTEKSRPNPWVNPTHGQLCGCVQVSVCMCVRCTCRQPSDEGAKPTADIRRLSSPIVNPNFEEDFTAALTMSLNTDDVLASLSCVSMALTSTR